MHPYLIKLKFSSHLCPLPSGDKLPETADLHSPLPVLILPCCNLISCTFKPNKTQFLLFYSHHSFGLTDTFTTFSPCPVWSFLGPPRPAFRGPSVRVCSRRLSLRHGVPRAQEMDSELASCRGAGLVAASCRGPGRDN